MSKEAKELGAELISRGELREGMKDAGTGVRFRGDMDLDMGSNHICYGYKVDTGSIGSFRFRQFTPDLQDPSTWGQLLTMVWDVWPESDLLPPMCDEPWRLDCTSHGGGTIRDSSAGLVIARALLDAWEVTM